MGRFFVNYGQFFDDATDFKFTPGSVCSPLFYLSNYLNATGTNDERFNFLQVSSVVKTILTYLPHVETRPPICLI